MTSEQELFLLIANAKGIGCGSSMDDLEVAEDCAFQIADKANQLQVELLDDIYAEMEIRRHG